MAANGWSLGDLYRTLETPGANRLRAAYGMKEKEDPLAFLLHLNLELGVTEAKGERITPPGLPALRSDLTALLGSDCIRRSS
jgi:hypothetical protein